MQEFESISASSYDPSALATKLTAKAAEGWSVVAIVPTGGDVTAFVTRGQSGASESTTPAEATEPEAKKDDEDTKAPALPAKTESEAEATVAAAAETVSEPKPEPASEPSGWAIAPESTTPKPEPTSVQPTLAASTYQPAASPGTEAVAAGAATPAAAAAPAVPAGWYADPAGRFELRYWDGSTWTEHVSRAGQQFTDPPVA